MSELLLHENLRGSAEDAEVRKIARVHTLTVLPRLDKVRKRSVLLFLHESELIDKDKPIVNLNGADLSEADLMGIQGITVEELEKKARSLKGATMRDGSKHP